MHRALLSILRRLLLPLPEIKEKPLPMHPPIIPDLGRDLITIVLHQLKDIYLLFLRMFLSRRVGAPSGSHAEKRSLKNMVKI